MSYYLSLSCSSEVGSLALFNEIEVHWIDHNESLKHSDFIFIAFEKLLKKAKINVDQLKGLFLDIGPGSFTGIRVGVSFAKALAYKNNLPIFTKNSLFLMLPDSPTQKTLIAMNAFRNSAYFLNWEGETQASPSIELISIKALESLVTKIGESSVSLRGNLLESYKNFWNPEVLIKFNTEKCFYKPTSTINSDKRKNLTGNSFPLHYPHALSFLKFDQTDFTTENWKTLLPYYLRESSAEELLKGSP